MGYGFRVEISGAYALFSRPELKIERMSYDVMTPAAARGILESVFWHPGMRYVIDEIAVLNPIRFTNIRRNEVSAKLPASAALTAANGSAEPLYLHTGSYIQQRAATVLKDVRYVVSAHFDMTEKASKVDTREKFYNIILRRLRKGQSFHQAYLGCREFPAKLRLLEEGERFQSELPGERDLGLMLYDMDYSDKENITATYFRAAIKDGVIDLRDCEVMR